MANTPLTRTEAVELIERLREHHQDALDCAVRDLWVESGIHQARVGECLGRLIEHFETTGL